MGDLRLVGVHGDGEHLVLADPEGGQHRLPVDEALRAAVRRDRAHLGQLQIEMGEGLRPREVQARIRAGATAEQVSAACGWPVDRVRRYEGPVLAEREHVASLAREVRLRRRGTEQVTLGAEASRRLAGRGVDPDTASWDSWRTDDGPWTVVLTFSAGGRERQARWHFDPAARSVEPADDESRWLSEQSEPTDGPLGGVRLAAVPSGALYDIEADGGVAGSGSGPAVLDDPLDLMTAMRSRRRERDLHRTSSRRHVEPTDVPGAAHPTRRRRQRAAEPLELDPTLLADPPAAHPPAGDVVGLDDAPAPDPHVRRRWPLADRMHDDSDVDGSGEDTVDDTGEVPLLVPDDLPEDFVDDLPEDFVDDLPEPDGDLPPDDPEQPDPEQPDPEQPDQVEDAAPGHAMTDEAAAQVDPPPAPARAASGRSRRASVPSWDDIMFGAKRD